MPEQKRERIIGIDLGTSNSEAAIMMGGKPTIIPSAEGPTVAGKMFPSIIAFTKDGQLLVGEPAKRQIVSNPQGTVTRAKRKMGTDHKYNIHGKEYSPQQIQAFLLQKIKRDAEAFIGEKITKAVITVPAYFNDNQRTATKDAGQIAGLEVVRLVNEPTAAAMAYGLEKTNEEHKILVFDFGGGTLDVTIMEFGGGTFRVISTSGDTQLGGSDMDEAIVDYICDEFKTQEGIDLRKDSIAIQRVREAGEKAKIELSTVQETDINLPYITADANGPKHLTMKLTRSKLEQIVTPIIERCRKPTEQAIADSKLTKKDISKVILVGGPTRMPIVQKFVEEIIGKAPERGVDPMECVALGAAIQGAILAGEVKDMILLDVTPLTLGIETLGGVMTPIIDRNTTIPIRKSKIFSTADDMQTAVTVHVLQGERAMAADNVSLGNFNLVGLPPAPRGIPQIEVMFDIDSSGILNVSAKDLGTGKEQKITITASTKLSDSDIKKFVGDAKQFEEEDKRKREEAELRNRADSLVYSSEKTLTEIGDKLSPDVKSSVEVQIKATKEALASKDTGKIKSAMDALEKVIQQAGASIYQQQAQRQQNTQQGEPPPRQEPKGKGDQKIYDAEYKVEE